MSRYTKTRPGGYYNDLLMGDEDDFKKLLKRYAICPPNNVSSTPRAAGSVSLGTINTGDGAPNQFLAGSTNALGIEMVKMPGASKIGYIELFKQARQIHGADAVGDVIRFNVSVAAQPNHDPVYFLPWQDNASVRLTIKEVPVGTHPTDPSIFFTAAINGCSIFFKGTAKNPTIYHCGGSTGYGSNIANAAQFWEEVLDEFSAEEMTAGSAKGGLAVQTSVNKSHYVSEIGITAPSTQAVTGSAPSTKRAKKYGKLLAAKHALGKLEIEEVSPWGCILGRRDALTHDWTFYLQENATITYHQFNGNIIKQLKKTAVQTTSYSVARPLIYREIFPNGPQHATLKAGLPKIR